MISKVFTPITAAATASGSGNETNVGSSRYVLVQNTSSVSVDKLVTLRTVGDTTIGTFRINGDSSTIIKKATTDTIYADTTTVYFTGVTITNI